jgi:hypothetical protein
MPLKHAGVSILAALLACASALAQVPTAWQDYDAVTYNVIIDHTEVQPADNRATTFRMNFYTVAQVPLDSTKNFNALEGTVDTKVIFSGTQTFLTGQDYLRGKGCPTTVNFKGEADAAITLHIDKTERDYAPGKYFYLSMELTNVRQEPDPFANENCWISRVMGGGRQDGPIKFYSQDLAGLQLDGGTWDTSKQPFFQNAVSWSYAAYVMPTESIKIQLVGEPVRAQGAQRGTETGTTPLPKPPCGAAGYVRDEQGNCVLPAVEVGGVHDLDEEERREAAEKERKTIKDRCRESFEGSGAADRLPPKCCEPPYYIFNEGCGSFDVQWVHGPNAGTTMAGMFNEVYAQAKEVPLAQAVDADGKAIPAERLAAGIGTGRVTLKGTLKDAKQGEPLHMGLPKDSPLQNALMVLKEPVTAGEVTLTLNEKPANLQIPEPSPKKYELKSGFTLDFTVNQEESHPLREALFYIKQPGGGLLRYDDVAKDWVALPVAQVADGFIAVVPGNSLFAIVLEKHPTPFLARLARILFLILFILGIRRLARQRRLEKETSPPGTKARIAAVALGILVALAAFIPAAFLATILSAVTQAIGWWPNPVSNGINFTTLFFLVTAAFNFAMYRMLKRGKRETLWGYGARAWLARALVWLALAAATQLISLFF